MPLPEMADLFTSIHVAVAPGLVSVWSYCYYSAQPR